MSLSTDRLYCLVGASTLAAAAGAAFMWAASAASAGTWIRPGKSSTKLVKEDVLSALHECKALLGPVHESVLGAVDAAVARSISSNSPIQVSSVAGLQQQLDAAAASSEAQAAHRLGVKPSVLQRALLAYGSDPAVAQLQAQVTAMNLVLEIPLREFTPIFVRVMSAQADALNSLAKSCTSVAEIQAKQPVQEEQGMLQALEGHFPLCIFTMNCALHCQQSSQFRAQLQRILEARVEQFKQWGCFQAAAAERVYMSSLGIKSQGRGMPQRGMMPGRL